MEFYGIYGIIEFHRIYINGILWNLTWGFNHPKKKGLFTWFTEFTAKKMWGYR